MTLTGLVTFQQSLEGVTVGTSYFVLLRALAILSAPVISVIMAKLNKQQKVEKLKMCV